MREGRRRAESERELKIEEWCVLRIEIVYGFVIKFKWYVLSLFFVLFCFFFGFEFLLELASLTLVQLELVCFGGFTRYDRFGLSWRVSGNRKKKKKKKLDAASMRGQRRRLCVVTSGRIGRKCGGHFAASMHPSF